MFPPSSITIPYWGKSEKKGTGRDHLGIQNSSIAVYTKLLPGLTNVTDRIRYYGFYCWILEQYQRKSVLTNNPEKQHQYIRRAELLLAFIMYHFEPDGFGYAGKDYVRKSLEKNKASIDLGKGALKRKEYSDSYWQYNTGAFGQYFVGSLINLSLIAVEKISGKNIYIRTEKGRQLAEAYDHSLPLNQKEAFLQIVNSGSFLRGELKEFGAFSLSLDLRNTLEWEAYLDLLHASDGAVDLKGEESVLRRQTIAAYLSWLSLVDTKNQETIWYPFLWDIYLNNGRLESTGTSQATTGWYYYYLNELTHFSLEAIFWAVLFKLDQQPGPYPFELLIEDLEQAGLQATGMKSGNHTWADWAKQNHDLVINEVSLAAEVYTKIDGAKKSPTPDLQLGEVIWNSLLILILVNENNRKDLPKLKKYAHSFGMMRPGNAITLLNNLIEKKNESSIQQIIRELLSWTINQHLSVALDKLQSSGKNVLKVIFDEGYLQVVEVVKPTFTGPRLKNLTFFLTDLKLLNADGVLTKEGEEYLKRLQL